MILITTLSKPPVFTKQLIHILADYRLAVIFWSTYARRLTK
jgi:hypothetical protein